MQQGLNDFKASHANLLVASYLVIYSQEMMSHFPNFKVHCFVIRILAAVSYVVIRGKYYGIFDFRLTLLTEYFYVFQS